MDYQEDQELMQLVDQELKDFDRHLDRSLRCLEAARPSNRIANAHVAWVKKNSSILRGPIAPKRQRADSDSSCAQQPNSGVSGSSSALWNAQLANTQLKHLVHQQVVQARELQQLMSRQVNQNLAFWFCHETRMTEIRSRSSLGSLADNKALHPRRYRQQVERDGEQRTTATRLVQEAQVFMLLQRVDYSFQQMDLVFQQHLANTWHVDTSGPQPFSQVRLRSALLPKGFTSNTPKSLHDNKTVNHHHDFAELVGCSVTHFDANTLLELIWKCFATRDKERCTSCDCSAESQVQDSPVSKKRRSACGATSKQLQKHAYVDTHPPTVCEVFCNTVTGNAIRVNGHFECFLPEAAYLEVDVNGALKKFSNAIVMDSMCKAAVTPSVVPRKNSTPQQQDCPQQRVAEFTRSVWLRVETLEDGRSMLRHVYRMWPLTPLEPVADDACSAKVLHQQRFHLMGQMLERAHSEMSSRFEKLVMDQFGEAKAKRNSMRKNDQANKQWWWPRQCV